MKMKKWKMKWKQLTGLQPAIKLLFENFRKMNNFKKFTYFIFFVILTISSHFAISENKKGTPFSVTGEQIELGMPDGWKVAWMDGWTA